MLEEFVTTALRKLMKTKYPHLELPAAIYAKVTKQIELGENFEYHLKILDENKQIDNNFPEFPRIVSKERYEVGTIVTVVMLYGKMNPYIIGEVV